MTKKQRADRDTFLAHQRKSGMLIKEIADFHHLCLMTVKRSLERSGFVKKRTKIPLDK